MRYALARKLSFSQHWSSCDLRSVVLSALRKKLRTCPCLPRAGVSAGSCSDDQYSNGLAGAGGRIQPPAVRLTWGGGRGDASQQGEEYSDWQRAPGAHHLGVRHRTGTHTCSASGLPSRVGWGDSATGPSGRRICGLTREPSQEKQHGMGKIVFDKWLLCFPSVFLL